MKLYLNIKLSELIHIVVFMSSRLYLRKLFFWVGGMFFLNFFFAFLHLFSAWSCVWCCSLLNFQILGISDFGLPVLEALHLTEETTLKLLGLVKIVVEVGVFWTFYVFLKLWRTDKMLSCTSSMLSDLQFDSCLPNYLILVVWQDMSTLRWCIHGSWK